MRCKGCDYTLWNIRARECPECGSSFKPSDFSFTLNSVRFCCPHCMQDYYGTGPQGELVPRAFTCVSCNTPIDMDEMVLLPTEGVAEEITRPDTMPWLERSKIGFFRALSGTVVRSMGAPGRLIELVPDDHPPTSALIYAAIVGAIIVLVGLSPMALFILIPASVGGAGGAAAWAGGSAGSVLFLIAAWVVILLVWGAASHLVLRATGATAKGIGRTYHAFGYATGANILMAIPCIGPQFFVVFALWGVVSTIIMLRYAQRVETGRAVAAVLAPPITLLIVAALAIFLYVTAITNGVIGNGTAYTPPPAPGPGTGVMINPAPPPASLQYHASHVLGALLEARASDPDAHPANVLSEGVSESLLPGTDPLAPGKGANISGAEIDALDPDATDEIITAIVAASPPTDIQRLGNFVFVHRGVPVDAPAQRWLLILAPHGPTPPDTYLVGLNDGSVQTLTPADFLERLDAENQAREAMGLPPIPPPHAVTP
jgi:hypothetical protein